MKRYSAMLLFQFRRVRGGRSLKRRLCEERIIVLRARTAESAYKKALRRGKSSELDYTDGDSHVFLEFIGIKELQPLGIEADEDEVWWAFREHLMPMERRRQLIPRKRDLFAFSWGTKRPQD